MQKKLKSNIWKYFLFLLTNRRNYVPILSIYFLSLPSTTAQQIGFYTGIGWLAGFLLEIPSGYISDKLGHKKALILAKFSMLFSTLFFVFGKGMFHFIFGSGFMALGFAFTSGTAGAFLHNTLVKLKKEKSYSNISGKIGAKVSFISAGMILLLPLLTKISLVMPIKIYLIFDIIGIIVGFLLYTPKMKYSAEDEEGENILSQLKRFRGTGFYITSLFIGIIAGILTGITPYKELFVKELGFPIIFIGSIMAVSRLVWFVVGHNLNVLKKISVKRLFFYEIFIFSGLVIIASQLSNPYIVGLLLAISIGYYYGRNPIVEGYYLDNFLLNRRYKATMLSIKQQVKNVIQSGVTFVIGFVMAISFSLGFLVAGVSMLVVVLGIYPFMKKYLK